MSDLLAYLAVFGVAVIPWFELFAIPPGIALGLNPVGVAVMAFVGNSAATVAVIIGWERILQWWQRRRGRSLTSTKRGSRSQRVFERYGVPGLALQGPVLSGMYLAVLIGLSLGAARRGVIVWALIGNALWTVVLVAGTLAGLSVLT